MTNSRRDFCAALFAGSALAAMPALAKPRVRRPHIITIVLDDVGYSDIGCFGAEIRTPHMDRLAREGLRYAHFDTKAVCSSTRAAMLTGRNSHTIGMPDVPDLVGFLPKGPERPSFAIPDNAENVAQVLKREGYATWAVGKWHLIPGQELPETAVHKSWPLQRGFDYFYGFARGWTDQYKPALVENDRYLKRDFEESYHLSADLVDKAVALVTDHAAKRSDQPFFLNLGFGAAHGPLQVPREYSAKYDAVYARGWDKIRSERFARMKRMGILPQSTLLPPREGSDRAWDDLTPDEKTVFARYMAVYAGFIEHCDEHIGRLLTRLDELGLTQNTLVVLLSDNGAASEAGQEGEFDGLYRPNTLSPAEQLRRIDELGTGKTQAEKPRPWAMVGNTPLRRYKLWPYSGGTRTPMVVRWPEGTGQAGAIRRQFVDVVDIGPTLLAAAGTSFPVTVNGVAQVPVAGRSFLPTFRSANAPGRQVQFFELRGNRAITSGKWRAVAMHDCGTPFEADKWSLFDLSRDFSEAVDVADTFPHVVEQMKALWQSEWAKYGGGGPLREPLSILCTSGGALVR
ncbi:arylsulfatase [Sphingorhabdus contaminans]|uniref:arylsulfatase n=1 Tax=Sphingorhabdus contaminans TaxID=1343899 RepID=UPI003D292623